MAQMIIRDPFVFYTPTLIITNILQNGSEPISLVPQEVESFLWCFFSMLTFLVGWRFDFLKEKKQICQIGLWLICESKFIWYGKQWYENTSFEATNQLFEVMNWRHLLKPRKKYLKWRKWNLKTRNSNLKWRI